MEEPKGDSISPHLNTGASRREALDQKEDFLWRAKGRITVKQAVEDWTRHLVVIHKVTEARPAFRIT